MPADISTCARRNRICIWPHSRTHFALRSRRTCSAGSVMSPRCSAAAAPRSRSTRSSASSAARPVAAPMRARTSDAPPPPPRAPPSPPSSSSPWLSPSLSAPPALYLRRPTCAHAPAYANANRSRAPPFANAIGKTPDDARMQIHRRVSPLDKLARGHTAVRIGQLDGRGRRRRRRELRWRRLREGARVQSLEGRVPEYGSCFRRTGAAHTGKP